MNKMTNVEKQRSIPNNFPMLTISLEQLNGLNVFPEKLQTEVISSKPTMYQTNQKMSEYPTQTQVENTHIKSEPYEQPMDLTLPVFVCDSDEEPEIILIDSDDDMESKFTTENMHASQKEYSPHTKKMHVLMMANNTI